MAMKKTKKAQSNEWVLFIGPAKKVVESPLTGNACHAIDFPTKDGLVTVNDLDMGEVYTVRLASLAKARVYRDVDESDFQFSWVMDEYNEDVMEAVIGYLV
jgi:hypothetical protein